MRKDRTRHVILKPKGESLAHGSLVANPFARVDYTLNNPDTLTKYKTAAQISEKVLAEVSKLVVPGSKIVEVCQQGDKLIEEEVAKVYRGKKVTKGMSRHSI